MKLLILLTADHAYIDSMTGKLYVLGAFNVVYGDYLVTVAAEANAHGRGCGHRPMIRLSRVSAMSAFHPLRSLGE